MRTLGFVRSSSVRRSFVVRTLFVALFCSLPYTSYHDSLRAAISSGYVSQRQVVIAPGVVHDQGTIETTTAGSQAVHIVDIDVDQPLVSVEAALSNDRIVGLERMSAQANRVNAEGHRAVAAINGDFWGPREAPIGLHIQNGELMSAGPSPRPTFGVEADGDPIIGSPDVDVTLRRQDGTTRAVTRVNQPRDPNQLVLYTSRFADRTPTDNSGTEIVLSGATLPLPSAGTLTATVIEVRTGAGNTFIGPDQIVLSGHGTAATYLNTLALGETLTIAIAITPTWADVIHAVGGGQFIVRNSAVDVDPHDPSFADVTHPRTAIGLKADGDIILVTVDGRQPGYSIGVRLDELGELMVSRGAVTALNMDGGGSTTMAVRVPGTDGVSVVNRGSDGFERAVANGLTVLSAAPTGPLARLVISPDATNVYVGTTIAYDVKGQDAAYNAVTLTPGEVAWSVTGGIGAIDAAGRLHTSAVGGGNVRAEARGVTGLATVTVVDTLSTLAIQPNPALVQPGAQLAFHLDARDGGGRPVDVAPPLAAWAVAGSIGTIDAHGVLTASAGGSGSVTATVGGLTATARVDVGRPPVLLEDFEDLSDMRPALARASSVTLTPSMRPDPVRAGTRAGRLSYNFRTNPHEAGTSAAYAAHNPLREIDGRPRRIGVWLYGDGSRHWVRGNYRDGTNTQKVIDFTGAATPTPTSAAACATRSGGIDWIGWKYLEAAVPADAILPLKWERVYIVETVDLCDNESAVYLDDLRAVYSDTGEDLIGPSVSSLLPTPGSVVHTSRPVIGGTVRDQTGGSGVAPASIRLTIDDVQVMGAYDAATGQVRYTPATPLVDGPHRAGLEAVDQAGNPALPFGDWTFRIDTGPDAAAPTIDRQAPHADTTSYAGRPRVSARIADSYRGVDPAALQMWIDDRLVDATWDPEAGVLWHAPAAPLADGVHHVAVRAADRETPANVASSTWTFSVDAIAPPAAPFRITWIADGGYFEGTRETAATAILGEHLAREAAAPPALLLFGGDLVENDQQINYDRAVAALNQVPAPRLVAAGNHEISGSLSRDRFWRTFGPTIAAADIGPVDVLVLDVASSSVAYDTSQFAWLEQELARSDARTVLIVLHVPTRDPFGSAHGLPAAEGARLEALFASAKLARPSRDITVLSGDVHAFARWTRDAVTYVISGGGGGAPDAPPDSGGFYHRLHINVDADGAATIDAVPLFESIGVSATDVSLLGGDRAIITATGDVFSASAPDMTMAIADPVSRAWTSNAPAASVAGDGTIEALVPGHAKIAVTSGGASASVAVTVTATLTSLRALTERAYTEGGIIGPRTIALLRERLDAAARGEPNALQSYISLVKRTTQGNHITPAWRDRLVANATFVVQSLQP